jgi:Protein of unknown function (DUF2933)
MKWNSSWLMLLCIVGMGVFFVLPALGVSLSGLLGVGLILLCPLSHLLMMRGMHTGRESCHQGPGNVAEGVSGGEGATPAGAAPRSLSAGQPVAAIAAGGSEPVRVERGEV